MFAFNTISLCVTVFPQDTDDNFSQQILDVQGPQGCTNVTVVTHLLPCNIVLKMQNVYRNLILHFQICFSKIPKYLPSG